MVPAALRAHLERYLVVRRAVGFAMRAEERLLKKFVGFLGARPPDGPIRAAAAVEWACSTERCGAGGRARRLSVVRTFLVYLHVRVPGTEIPGPRLLPRPPRGTPRLYSDAEIGTLLAATRKLGPPGSLRPATVTTLIGLLASTGLRAGEALRLADGDVKLDDAHPHLVVRLTKFRKSRLVPVHPSVADALRAYAAERHRLGYDAKCQAFFVSERRGPLAYSTLEETFVHVVRRIGLRSPSGQRQPSMHGLRHSFAVRRLLAWYATGDDVSALIPNLSVYLGHAQPQDTFWYLTGTPELLRLAAERFEAQAVSREGS